MWISVATFEFEYDVIVACGVCYDLVECGEYERD